LGAEEDIWSFEGGSERKLEKLHNEEHVSCTYSPNIIRVMKIKEDVMGGGGSYCMCRRVEKCTPSCDGEN